MRIPARISVAKYAFVATLIVLSGSVHASDKRALLLRSAIHCLAVKKFLPRSTAPRILFGSFLDDQSYPGQKVLYVVDYPKPLRSDGFVFALFLTEHNGREILNIQNNGRFVLSKDGDRGIKFVEPPLGGDWTQQHLVSAIKRIESHPKVAISTNHLLGVDPSVTCEAYTDP
jgi:hypothetical protein